MMFVWCVLVVLTLAPEAAGTDAGILVRITQTALDYGRQVGLIGDILEDILKKLPDPLQEQTFFIFGINITGLRYGCLKEIASELKFVPGKGIRFSIEDANITLHGTWRVIGFDRVFKRIINGVKFDATVAVKNDVTHPLTLEDCHLKNWKLIPENTSSQSSIHFILNHIKKGLQKIAQPLVNAFNWIFPDALPNFLCSQLKIIADITKSPTFKDILSSYSEVDFSVMGPVISETSLDLAVKGVLHDTKQHTEHHLSPKDFSFSQFDDQKMLYIVVSAFTINSLAFVLHNKNVFRLEITDNMIPPNHLFRLSSTTFGAFIPKIALDYPDKKMKLLIRTDHHPIITFDENKATIQLSCIVSVYVIQSINEDSPVFDLGLKASASVHLHFTEQTLRGDMTLNKFDVTINKSEVEEFEVLSLKEFLEMVLKDFMIPIFNAHFQKGFSFLISHINQKISFIGTLEPVNTEIRILKDFVLIETDFKYTRQVARNEMECI